MLRVVTFLQNRVNLVRIHNGENFHTHLHLGIFGEDKQMDKILNEALYVLNNSGEFFQYKLSGLTPDDFYKSSIWILQNEKRPIVAQH